MRQRVSDAARAVVGAFALFTMSGCGGVLYAAQAGGAAAKLEEAKQVGAEQSAPYEYYYAQAHMKKASEEASQGDYGDAAELAEIAEEYADKAIRLAREAHRGAGR
ncbi:MAG: hypothetical protein CSA75_04325 [Sorangium cellulosum]|nr:MAG: hypothetical protein CSA75_04325 [Sorangium cellulosum]